MAFRVEISPRAFDDLDQIARYINQKSVAQTCFSRSAAFRPPSPQRLPERIAVGSTTPSRKPLEAGLPWRGIYPADWARDQIPSYLQPKFARLPWSRRNIR